MYARVCVHICVRMRVRTRVRTHVHKIRHPGYWQLGGFRFELLLWVGHGISLSQTYQDHLSAHPAVLHFCLSAVCIPVCCGMLSCVLFDVFLYAGSVWH